MYFLKVHRQGCETATTGEHEGKSFLSCSLVKEFWEIYKRDSRAKGVPDNILGSYSSFRIAYEEVKDSLRLQGSAVGCCCIGYSVDGTMRIIYYLSQGDFNKCEFCNTCRYMAQRETLETNRQLIFDCKHAHIVQQGILLFSLMLAFYYCINVISHILICISIIQRMSVNERTFDVKMLVKWIH